MNLRNIAVVLSANTTSFRSQMAMAARDVDSFDKRVGQSATGMEKFGKVAGTVAKAGIVAIAVAFGTAVAAAMSFETRMRNVNSISHLSEQAFREQNAAVLEMSKRFPQSANTLAEGLYDIASSGFQAGEGLMVLEASAIAASAGMSDTATSAKAITAVLNAYGLEADQANRVGNVLFQGVNVGVMSFEELAGSIGDTVGMAAAAGVSIEDLTAGIATMTLSGISAAEASTSMNRVIQALIQPSDSLSASIQALGYESGSAMLETLGLHGTMEKLREVTGGNIEVLLRYFPEIRGARGALALMSAEGKNYNDVQNAMNEAQDKGGAMAKTFAEQMKSTSAQLKLIKNDATAFAISIGTVFLPYIQDGIKEVKDFGGQLADLARRGRTELEPFFKNLRPLLENTKELFGDIAGAVGPIVAAFGALVALGVIAVFNDLSTALVATTGFLVDHKEIVAGLVTMYGVHLVAAAFAAGGAIDGLLLRWMYLQAAIAKTGAVKALMAIQEAAIATSIAFTTGGIASAARTAAAAIGGMVTPLGLVSIALAGIAVAYVLVQKRNDAFRTSAREMFDEWSTGMDPANDSLNEFYENSVVASSGLELVRKRQKELNEEMKNKELGDFGDDIQDQLKILKETEKQFVMLSEKYSGYGKVAAEVQRKTGLSFAEAQRLIEEQGFSVDDLADGTVMSETIQQKAIEKTVAAREEWVAKTLWALGEVKAPQDQMRELAGLSAEEFEAQAGALMEVAKAAEDFGKKVGEAWASQQDIVAALGQNVDATGQDILKWYDTMIDEGNKFSENIRKAIEMGYDPALISRMLLAGPEQAGPLLEQMVENQGQTFIDSVNASERALQELNLKAVELGRLTNLAMSNSSDTLAKDLKNAMAIATIIMASGGKTTMKALTDALHVGEAEVTRIAEEYGISLAAALDPVRASTGLGPIPRGKTQPRNANAEGGYIDPAMWGDTNADSVPSWLMPGEVVIKKAAVAKWGVDPLLKLNQGIMPSQFAGGYAAGGVVPGVPNYPPGHFGDTSEAASAQTYMAAVAAWSASRSAFAASSGGGGGMAGSVADWVHEAMRLTGTPESWFSALMARVKLESGGNPRAINLWDSNAKKGIPSKGLFQTIDPTFRAYAMPGMGDIWNPVHNGVAAIRYMKARYGSIFNINPRTGYSEGGVIPYGKYDKGGYLPTGLSIADNQTGSPERVMGPRDVMPQIMVNVNVYIGNEQFRGTIRQEIAIERDQQNRRTRSMADA